MKLRSTILLLLITGGLAAYIFLFDKKQHNTREQAEIDKVLAKFDPEKITGVDITNGDTVIQLRKSGDQWKLTSPVEDRADSQTVITIVNAAAAIEKSGVVSDLGDGDKRRDAFKDYGVLKAKVRLKLIGTDAPAEMCFGRDTAYENKIYARLETDKTVSVVTNDLRNLLTKSVEEFRDHKLTPFESSAVRSLQIKTPAGQIDLAETGDNWNLTAPIKARAASGQALDLVSKCNNVRIDKFITQDEKNLARFGLAEPVGTIYLGTGESGNSVEIQIGSPVDKDAAQVYARVPGRPSIYVIPKAVADVLAIKPNDLRDKKLARASKDLIDRITVEVPGKPRVVLARKQEQWSYLEPADRKDAAANPLEVTRLIEILNNTETSAFVTDTSSDLPKYGLDQPSLRIRLGSFASENTAEGTKGEIPVATVEFGKADGNQVYARLAEEPFIVAVQPGILNNLPTTAVSFKSLDILAIEPKSIQEITFQSPGSKPLPLKRDGDKWTSTSGTPVPTNLDTLVGKLAGLNALKWVPVVTGDPGFGNAQTVQFKAGDTVRKLLLGNPTTEGSAYAKFDGSDDVFTLSTDAVQALTPIVPVPETSPTPAATTNPSPSSPAK